jgi:hypothetical protein
MFCPIARLHHLKDPPFLRKVTAFQTATLVTPSEKVREKINFGCSINDTENVCDNTRIACCIVTILIYFLGQ